LGAAQGRPERAADLARAVGAQDCVVLIADPAVAAMVPAPGFTRTLRGGKLWRAFVENLTDGRHRALVDLPTDEERTACALVRDGIAIIFLGGDTTTAALDDIERGQGDAGGHGELPHALKDSRARFAATSNSADRCGSADWTRKASTSLRSQVSASL